MSKINDEDAAHSSGRARAQPRKPDHDAEFRRAGRYPEPHTANAILRQAGLPKAC
jgi:hypothetical protein